MIAHSHPLIIPTILIPLAAFSVGVSAVATYVAGLFGVTLKTEGPKKLLEVLLKPRVIITAILIQLVAMGAWKGFLYFKNYPSLLNILTYQHSKHLKSSGLNYENTNPEQFRHFVQGENKTATVTDLQVVWSKQLSNKSKLGPFVGGALSAHHVFYGVDDGFIYELNPEDGSEVRKFFIGTVVSPRPIVLNGKLYGGEGSHDTHHARIYQFDLKSGNFSNSFQTKGHIEGNPLVFSDKSNKETTLFVPSGSDGVYALDPDTLKLKWHVNEGHTDSGVEVIHNRVFNGTGREKGNLEKNRSYANAYDFHTGKLLWKREIPASSWMTPIELGNEVCFAFGEVYFKSEVGGIACFAQETGMPGMFYYQGAPIISEIIKVNDDLVFADGFGKVCRVSHDTGRALWCTQAGIEKSGKAFPGVVYDSRRNLFVYASKSSGLYLLNPKDGTVISHWEPTPKEEPWGTNFAAATLVDQGYLIANDAGVFRLLKQGFLQ